MDNASKALIMAGAILIAVALVSLGVYLYQSAESKVRGGAKQVDASQMIMLNSEIEKFEGKIKGSELKQLIRLVNADNKSEVFPADLLIYSGDSGSVEIPSLAAGTGYDASIYRDSTNYVITVHYDADGWVNIIRVKTSI